ncbi:MAG TPA: glycoside hydrolase family 2 TIM barrel-domain containing protein [Actinomycetota bacterium]|nr:glycoside hydrolase family 2 TIM barrel-domain containing protein [Actinomycetota bacterium]
MRARSSLDGTWRFWPDVNGAFADDLVIWARPGEALGEPRPIAVPGPWQAQFDDLRLWSGGAFYERDFAVPRAWRGRAIRVCFGAVDYACAVWVNGRLAGTHEGGYLPFEIDVTSLVRAEERNTLGMRVIDPGPDDPNGAYPFAEVPHGKQSWYGPLGGIWQSVFLEASHPRRVERMHVHGDVGGHRARVRVRLAEPAHPGDVLEVAIRSPSGTDDFVAAEALDPGASETTIDLGVGDAEPWDVDAPRLYSVAVALRDAGGRALDEWRDTFGFRTLAARDGRLWLNGRPLYVRGALDQDYYLGSICTPPSDDVLRRQVERARELGLNLLRCHIKVPDPRYLAWTDRLGMLVWSELPNSWRLTEASARRALDTLAGMIERDFNHPSIALWTIVNESWGVDLADSAEHRMWLGDAFARVKEMDPTRLVVDNSPCEPNFHVRSDVNDFHFYRAVPDQCDEWSRWTEGWVRDPARTFSPHGDAEHEGGEPLVVSEFGNWGLPDIGALLGDDGEEPWWFDTGDEDTDADFVVEGVQEQLDEGVVRPRGVRDRYEAWDLDEVFGSWRGFVDASQWHQHEALVYEIEDMRRHAALSGYVVTELTDCHWECNGLLDMARNPKVFHDVLRHVNAPDVVLPSRRRLRFCSGDEIAVHVSVSHFSARPGGRWRVGWSAPALGAGGELQVEVEDAAVSAAEPLRATVPRLDVPARVHIDLVLLDRRGAEVNRNRLVALAFPATAPSAAGTALVAPRWDRDVARHVEGGGRAVVVAASDGALPDGLGVALQAREGTKWKGEWAQGMTWLRPALTRGLALEPWVDLVWAGLTPRHVLRGYRPERRADVLAGLYLGWIHSTAAAVAGFRHGAGAGILCTFPLLDAPDDPLAAWMLARLTDIAGAPTFAPETPL